MNLYINLPSSTALGAIHELAFYKDYLKNNVQIRPYYQFVSVYGGIVTGIKKNFDNCMGGGQYCAIDPDGLDGAASGKDIVNEQLRQLCIFKIDQDLWWSYMKRFADKCGKMTVL